MATARRICPKPKGCGRKFTPRRSANRRKYCYDCSPERASSGPESQTPPPPPPQLPTGGEMATAVAAELERIQKTGSLQGAVAMRLARTLDDPHLGAAQVASISDKLLKIMEPLIKAAPREPDEIDEFTRRFEERAASA